MKLVPVFDTAGKQLSVCHPARARQILDRGRATIVPLSRPESGFGIKLMDSAGNPIPLVTEGLLHAA